jgi:hypothetical protein
MIPSRPREVFGYLADYFGIESGICTAGSDANECGPPLVLFFRKYNYKSDPKKCVITGLTWR